MGGVRSPSQHSPCRGLGRRCRPGRPSVRRPLHPAAQQWPSLGARDQRSRLPRVGLRGGCCTATLIHRACGRSAAPEPPPAGPSACAPGRSGPGLVSAGCAAQGPGAQGRGWGPSARSAARARRGSAPGGGAGRAASRGAGGDPAGLRVRGPAEKGAHPGRGCWRVGRPEPGGGWASPRAGSAHARWRGFPEKRGCLSLVEIQCFLSKQAHLI